MKPLDMNLTKYIQDLYAIKYKLLLMVLKKELNK